jgi:outer membrane protein assembly factor BamA
MKTKPGTIFSDVQLDDDLKAIYSLGFFDNILMNLTMLKAILTGAK